MGDGRAFRFLGDVSSAADATQGTFMLAYRSRHSYHGGNFRAWLYRIATNVCYSELRARQRRRQTVFSDLGEYDLFSEAASDDEQPESYALRRDMVRVLEQGLRLLQEDQRLAVVLCDLQRLSYEEAAQVANCSLGTIKSRLSRGRSKLRKFLRASGELLELSPRSTSEEEA